MAKVIIVYLRLLGVVNNKMCDCLADVCEMDGSDCDPPGSVLKEHAPGYLHEESYERGRRTSCITLRNSRPGLMTKKEGS